jgi:hypothetical protein
VILIVVHNIIISSEKDYFSVSLGEEIKWKFWGAIRCIRILMRKCNTTFDSKVLRNIYGSIKDAENYLTLLLGWWNQIEHVEHSACETERTRELGEPRHNMCGCTQTECYRIRILRGEINWTVVSVKTFTNLLARKWKTIIWPRKYLQILTGWLCIIKLIILIEKILQSEQSAQIEEWQIIYFCLRFQHWKIRALN